MQTPAQRMRALVDQLAKAAANRPQLPTGGDVRTTDEAMGTGAAARGLARMNTKKAKVIPRTLSLACLQKNKR